MLINDPGNVLKLAEVTGTKFLQLLALSAVVSLSAHALDAQNLLFPTGLVGVLIAAVSMFLAFRINLGYARWWRAREIWGGLVNESRALGVYVIAMLRSGDGVTDADRARQRRIVLRHIGFVNALRLHLRRQGPEDWQAEIWDRRINGHPLFPEGEVARLKAAGNVPTQAIALQAEEIAGHFGGANDYRLATMAGLLRELHIRQGQAEAIKNTVLAWGYAYYTKLLARALATIVILSQLNNSSVTGTVLVAVVATVFLTIEQVGRNLDNPFEGSFNDTPMSSLCRAIEIDLLQDIGEPCDLEPLAPENGRLD